MPVKVIDTDLPLSVITVEGRGQPVFSGFPVPKNESGFCVLAEYMSSLPEMLENVPL